MLRSENFLKKEKILLISAITQIVFLDFKEYAVINCSVEIAKKIKVYHGLINASLKKISKDKEKLKKINIKFDDLPLWFRNRTKLFDINQKRLFINNFSKEPSIHLVFKDKDKLKNFEEELIKTTEISGFLVNKKNITNIKMLGNFFHKSKMALKWKIRLLTQLIKLTQLLKIGFYYQGD